MKKLITIVSLVCLTLTNLQSQEPITSKAPYSDWTAAEISYSNPIEELGLRTHVGWELVLEINYYPDGTEASRVVRSIYYEPMVRNGFVSYLDINWNNLHEQVYTDIGIHQDPSLYQTDYPFLNYDYLEYNKIYVE